MLLDPNFSLGNWCNTAYFLIISVGEQDLSSSQSWWVISFLKYGKTVRETSIASVDEKRRAAGKSWIGITGIQFRITPCGEPECNNLVMHLRRVLKMKFVDVTVY